MGIKLNSFTVMIGIGRLGEEIKKKRRNSTESNSSSKLKEFVMEKSHQWWKFRWLTFKNATIIVCLLNLFLALFILQEFLSASPFPKSSSTRQPNSALLRYIKESEDVRRAMMPLDLIKRVREIEKAAYGEPETVENKDTKQTTAVNLVSRLNNIRSYSDPSSIKALEEWRKRKIERARQRELGKNGTAIS